MMDVKEKECVYFPAPIPMLHLGASNIGQTSQPSFKFKIVNTVHDSPANAENMGTLNPGVNTLTSSFDYYSCKDNAIAINGYQPCTISGQAATKAIYRQFYLSAPATIYISGYNSYCGGSYGGLNTDFSGKITDGIAGLTPLPAPFRCFIRLPITAPVMY